MTLVRIIYVRGMNPFLQTNIYHIKVITKFNVQNSKFKVKQWLV